MILKIQNLHKIYPNGTHALKNVSLSVEAGEFLVIIGLSGGLVYFASMAGTTPTTPTEKTTFTVGTTLAIGRVPHPPSTSTN